MWPRDSVQLCPDLPSRPGLAAKPLLAASLEAGAAAHGATEHRPRRASGDVKLARLGGKVKRWRLGIWNIHGKLGKTYEI